MLSEVVDALNKEKVHCQMSYLCLNSFQNVFLIGYFIYIADINYASVFYFLCI